MLTPKHSIVDAKSALANGWVGAPRRLACESSPWQTAAVLMRKSSVLHWPRTSKDRQCIEPSLAGAGFSPDLAVIDIVAVTDPMWIPAGAPALLESVQRYTTPERIEIAMLESASSMAPRVEDSDPRLQPEFLPGYFRARSCARRKRFHVSRRVWISDCWLFGQLLKLSADRLLAEVLPPVARSSKIPFRWSPRLSWHNQP